MILNLGQGRRRGRPFWASAAWPRPAPGRADPVSVLFWPSAARRKPLRLEGWTPLASFLASGG